VNAASELVGALDRIGNVVTSSRDLLVKGFGILLLRRSFDRLDAFKDIEDPTEIILGRKVGGLGSKEMIPEL
jgi:hypothetical protein